MVSHNPGFYLSSDGRSAVGIRCYEDALHHFGRRSGDDWVGADGLTVDGATMRDWFGGHTVRVVETMSGLQSQV